MKAEGKPASGTRKIPVYRFSILLELIYRYFASPLVAIPLPSHGTHCLEVIILKSRNFTHSQWNIVMMALFIFLQFFLSTPVFATEIIIVGDIQYKPVAEIVSYVNLSLRSQVKSYAISEVKGRLASIVEQENAAVVVALGVDAVEETQELPAAIPVVYGLLIAPPKIARPNVTGVYMSTPVSEYVSIIKRYLPSMNKVSVVGSKILIKTLLGYDRAGIAAYQVNSSIDLVETVSRLGESDSILLLPDVSLLTAAVMEKVYLFSFRRKIPLLGISEGHVKQGSLFALVFDSKTVGRQIGDKVQSILNHVDIRDIPQTPPKKFHLFINANTAKKMGIDLPDEMINKAKKIY
jgi:putative tryptophan/tyrosine transport system substrate-binding protein